MISPIEIYQDAARDDANKSENGYMPYEMFNRYLRRVEINLLKFLTGDLVMAPDFPIPYNTQKCKDYLKRFIASHKANNSFELPDDYFYWDNLYKIGDFKTQDCDTDEIDTVEGCNTQIPILDGQVFFTRCKSFIPGLKPSSGSPIAKIVDNKVITEPKNIGSMCLEYIRYPKFGRIEVMVDIEHNDEVPDPDKSQDCEWDEWAREPLVWGIVNLFSKHTREKSLREVNTMDKPRG